MAKPDQLFELIHSLDLNEKRYFKLFATLQKKDSIIIQLFNVIAKQKVYSEEKVRAAFEGEKFLDQLSVTKNHLHDSILRALRGYHLKWSIDGQLYGLLQDMQLLYEKRLIDQCSVVMRKMKRIAKAFDKHKVMLEVLEWEQRLLSAGFYADTDEADIDQISEEYYECLGLLQNEREYQDLQAKLFNNYYKVGIERKNDNYKTNDQIVNQFALKQRDRALTYKSQLCYLNIHAQYNKVNGNWEEAFKYRTELKELILSREKPDHSDLLNLFTSINNLIPIAMKLEKYDMVDQLLRELRNIVKKPFKFKNTREIEIKILSQGTIAELALCVKLGRKDQGLAAVDRVLEQMIELRRKERKFPLLHLYYNMSYFYLSIGEYSKALRWLNEILNDTGIKSIEDLHASTRILTMILQFELGRGELLEYLARSTYRYLNKLEGLYEFERLMLKFMRKYTKIHFAGELKQELSELLKELELVAYEPGDRNELSTLDLPSWVTSKIQEKPLYVIMAAKNAPGKASI